ncbi:MAG: VWA domain-containing protein [Terriglobia bacterium]|nr:VWA domain-containing protein [Terriglobia bacterium]
MARDKTMRKVALFLILAAMALPALADRRVTVDQLEQTLATLHGKQDAEAAWQISNLDLSERLSAARLKRLLDGLPGDKSRDALRALADESAFLNPPPAEMPQKPAPSVAEQRRIMGLTVNYVSKTLRQLPNFLATRDTTHFLDSPQAYKQQGAVTTMFRPLHSVGESRVTVRYKDGRELVDSGSAGKSKGVPPEQGLSTWGEFGPILSTVLLDAAQNKLAWSHWEQGDSGPLAVFMYSVPRDRSHYELDYCCVADSTGTRKSTLHELAGYQGEMAVDPATGAILRLKIEADLKPGEAIARAALVVEYGPVEIGGKGYICPKWSIALSIAHSTIADKDVLLSTNPMGAGGTFTPSVRSVVHTESASSGPEQTLLNEAVFGQYHVFRADMRVLSENEGGPAATQPSPVAGEASAAEPSATGTTASVAPVPLATTSLPATAEAAPAAAPVPAPVSAIPEISVMEATGLPNLPANTFLPAGYGFTLRTTSRLVDVGVVAYDKKGHPVTDLKEDDFEIYDNGQKQTVRFFSQAGTTNVPNQPSQLASATEATPPSVFTNHADASQPSAHEGTVQGNTTVVLMDASTLAWGDLTYARSEILRFLKSLPADERVGLYVMRLNGFDVLQEPTSDHTAVATKLSRWIPDAQALAEAQDEERRNRQQIEFVHSVGDLAYVNGNGIRNPETFDNVGGGPASAASTTPIDAQLQDLGSNPAAGALAKLLGVARHMAPLPAHKSLVWVASDNALADWSNLNMRSEKMKSDLRPLAIELQDALNNGHISIYPLDASQLEAGGVGADIGTRNVLVMGHSDRDMANNSMGDAAGSLSPGRQTAQMQQDLHPIQGVFRDVATATGGRAFRRSGDIARELNAVVEDGRAAYLLSFMPGSPADDKYHNLLVKLRSKRKVVLRYRTGYFYAKEPTGMKDRFREAVWQGKDANDIGLTAEPVRNSNQWALKVTIDATGLQMAQGDGRWIDKIDIFVVKRDDTTQKAQLTGKTLLMRLKPATYQKALHEGIPFEEPVDVAHQSGSLRVLVVDENSGRMGTVTVPDAAFNRKP